MENKSEVAGLRQRIQEEYEAAHRAMTAPAMTAPHKFITKRMENIYEAHARLTQLVGQQEATRIVVTTMNEVGDPPESEPL